MEEVLYSFRIVAGNRLEIAKWVDGSERPTDVYTITMRGKGTCNCQGSMRTPYCKHRQMVDHMQKGFPSTNFIGSFYNYTTDTLYHPDDGEGIPLKGIVNIEQLVQTAGRLS